MDFGADSLNMCSRTIALVILPGVRNESENLPTFFKTKSIFMFVGPLYRLLLERYILYTVLVERF
jgi:hypothetical protein